MLDLMDELQVGRHARSEIEAKLDRRDSQRSRGLAVTFIYCHTTTLQQNELPSTAGSFERRITKVDSLRITPVFSDT